jgi:putative nucleotidyltransferase with HDIG domain
VAHMNERWDGSGSPAGKRGESIPRLGRICSVAQTLDAFATEHGPETALRMLRARRGTWFDPELVRVAQQLHTSGRLWTHCQARNVESTRVEVLRLDPAAASPLTSDRVDRICEAFGNVVDAKSPFTFHHSLGVTEVAVAIAMQLDLAPERVSLVRRAAFLHDIGKLAVPNHILDKRGRLDAREWAVITRHPKISGSILQRVGAFRELASLAAEHHERLDGSGYPFGLTAAQISVESRVIALADCYSAMAENRPYRPGLDPQDIVAEIGRDVPTKFDPVCFHALKTCIGRWNGSMPLSVTRLKAPVQAVRAAHPPLALAM